MFLEMIFPLALAMICFALGLSHHNLSTQVSGTFPVYSAATRLFSFPSPASLQQAFAFSSLHRGLRLVLCTGLLVTQSEHEARTSLLWISTLYCASTSETFSVSWEHSCDKLDNASSIVVRSKVKLRIKWRIWSVVKMTRFVMLSSFSP